MPAKNYQIFFVNKFDWVDKNPMTTISTFFCHALAEVGFRTTLLTGGRKNADHARILRDYYGLEKPANLEIVTFERHALKWLKSAFFFYVKVFLFIRRGLSRNQQTIVISRNTTFLPFMFLLRSFFRVKTIFETHGYHGRLNLPGMPDRNGFKRFDSSFQYHAYERLFLNGTDGLVCITSPQQELYRRDFFKGLSVFLPLGSPPVVPNGKPTHEEDERFWRRTLVYAGRLTHHIDVETLLEALQQLHKYPIRFLWLGLRDPDIEILKRQVKQNGLEGRVELRGWLGHKSLTTVLHKEASAGLALYKPTFRSAAVTSPSKIFDYFAAGLPVIAPDLPTVRDVLDTGENGILYTAGQARSLAQSILKLFSDREAYLRMHQGALKSASNFSWSKRAERFMHFVATATAEIL